MPTDKQFTSQTRLAEGYVGTLYDYVARAYDPVLGRFISPDTIVPGTASSGALNRYSYVSGNPLKYVDPSGHYQACDDGVCFDADSDSNGLPASQAGVFGTSSSNWNNSQTIWPFSDLPINMSISSAGLNYTIGWEDPRPSGIDLLKPYNDSSSKHHCTIGFGILIHTGSCTGGETKSYASYEEAYADFADKITGAAYQGAVKALVKVRLTQAMFDALLDFTFNAGSGNLADVAEVLNVGTPSAYVEAAKKIQTYVWAGGDHPEPGLERRRNENVRAFQSDQIRLVFVHLPRDWRRRLEVSGDGLQ